MWYIWPTKVKIPPDKNMIKTGFDMLSENFDDIKKEKDLNTLRSCL